VHFGLGEFGAPDSAEIRWMSGAITRVEAPAPGRYHGVRPPASRNPEASRNASAP